MWIGSFILTLALEGLSNARCTWGFWHYSQAAVRGEAAVEADVEGVQRGLPARGPAGLSFALGARGVIAM